MWRRSCSGRRHYLTPIRAMSNAKEPNAAGFFAKESLLVLGTLITDVLS